MEAKKNAENCDGFQQSDCCNVEIIYSDICSRCKEHCETQCMDCDEQCIDKVTIEDCI